MAVAMIMVVVMTVFLVVFLVMILVVFLVMIFLVLVVPVAVPMTAAIHFLQEAHGVQKGDPESKKDELGQPKPEGCLFVQNIGQDVHGGQVHKAARCNENQTISGHFLRQKSHRGPNHGRKGRSELCHNGVLFTESVLDENGKVSQLVGYFVEQYRKRRQTAPRFHEVYHACGSRKIGKGGSNGKAVGELELLAFPKKENCGQCYNNRMDGWMDGFIAD